MLDEKPYRAEIPPLSWHPHTVEGMERAVVFEPGYNARGTKWGVSSMKIRFLLRGEHGATQFVMDTGWVPGEPMSPRNADYYPTGRDLGYHALRPQCEDQWSHDDCEYLGGRQCFNDGSGLQADPVLEAFIREGEPAVWAALEELYLELAAEALRALEYEASL